jgi:hypothetical protein
MKKVLEAKSHLHCIHVLVVILCQSEISTILYKLKCTLEDAQTSVKTCMMLVT